MANDKHTKISRPLARSERLLVEAIGDESVIYDLDTNDAHALKPLAAAVFMYANGANTTAEIAELAAYRLGTAVTEAEVAEAVAQLEQLALLDAPQVSLLERGISRRDALKTFGAVGAGTLLVSSISATGAYAAVAPNAGDFYCATDSIPGVTSVALAGCFGEVVDYSTKVLWPSGYLANGDEVAAGDVGGPVKVAKGKTQPTVAVGNACVYNDSGATGYYAIVPCDGHDVCSGQSYECANLVCVPTSSTDAISGYYWGKPSTGWDLTAGATLPTAPYNVNYDQANNTTEFPGKWCTNKNASPST